MISAEFHIVLHLVDVDIETVRAKLGIYQELYEVFSQVLPQWLMTEFNNPAAQNDYQETYAHFIPKQLGLPAYIVLSLIIPENTTSQAVAVRIKKELDDTFLPYRVPYKISVQTAQENYFFT